MERIESIILSNLLFNNDYLRDVIPFIDEAYFHDNPDKIVFGFIKEFVDQYKNQPTKQAILLEIGESAVAEQDYEPCLELVESLTEVNTVDQKWLKEKTEKFCQDKAMYNAVMEAINIIDGTTEQGLGAIPDIMKDALSISFETNIGHDYLGDYKLRYAYYHKKEYKIPTGFYMLDKITRGGFSKKTLNILLAGTGVGKTFAMTSIAANCMMEGKNVLYITMEMAEEEISRRVDANLLNVDIEYLDTIPEDKYYDKCERLIEKTKGRLKIKEYPTASANVGHFRHLLNELELKDNFVPDIIFVDYINIMSSQRFKNGSNVGSYQYVKAISEELRGLAGEKNVPIVSATQLTRDGFKSSDPGMEDTSESWGLPQTVDFMVAMITSEMLEKRAQIVMKQLKNRYSDKAKMPRFTIGMDKSKMRMYDVEESAQDLAGAPTQDDDELERMEEHDKKAEKFSMDKLNKLKH
jgi:replicative DNA helicase